MKTRTAARLACASALVATTLQLIALALLLLSLASPVVLPAAVELTPGTPVAFVGFLAYPLVGGLIAARRPANPVGWLLLAFSAGVGLSNAIYLYGIYGLIVSSTSLPGAEVAGWADAWLWIISLCPLPAVLLVYPTGRVLSPGWRWPLRACVVPAVLAGGIAVALWGESDRRLLLTGELPAGWAQVFEAVVIPALLVLILIGVTALVVRFRQGSWEERQQIKWVVLGSSYLLLSGVLVVAFPGLLPPLVAEFLSIAGFMSVPAAIGVAILRYRLYDIDRIINRALVYGALSASLAGIYAVFILALQTLLSAGAKDIPDLAIAASTLGVAALFRPLRRRIQDFIDRRFYRSRYDAAMTVEAFSAHLRDEVTLEAVTGDLLAVVHKTMQPVHASLWLRPQGQR